MVNEEKTNFITEVDILDEAKDCFLTYAEEVLTDRAIPAAEDGLLSSQRKILWTMEDVLKMDNKGKTKKCNALVGSTLATAYFHGDISCYGVLCKMAQKYLMRYPLIHGQGNLGVQEDNDMVANSRYTEAKPSVYADLMMLDYKKNPVPTKETYNGEYMEPVFLPSFFPNSLCNGRQAIGISMAHSSPPHNLTEVCNGIIHYLENPDITIDELMNDIKGPDFPLGGIVINAKDVREAFLTGRTSSSLKVRGDYIIEDDKIIFTSIPYRTYRNKIKEQLAKNADVFAEILEDYDDESNLGNNRLVFKVKKGISHTKVLAKLFKLTDLQTTVSYNMNFIVNGTPTLCSLKDLIKSYVNHQENIMITIATYDRDKAIVKAHVLKGISIMMQDLDSAIDIIKNADDKADAQTKLIAFFKIDEEQAKAILDITLSRLTKLDRDDLLEDLKTQQNIIEESNQIITNAKHRDEVLIKRIISMRDKYGDERRTKLENIEEPKEGEEAANVVPEKCIVITTESGNIKRVPAAALKTQHRATKGIKTQDDITSNVIRTNTIDQLMIFTNLGRMYRLLVDKIPVGDGKAKGVPIRSLVELAPNETVQTIYSIYKDTDSKYVLFVTKKGLVKKTALDEYKGSRSMTKGANAIKLKDGDSLACVTLIKDEDIILVTRKGMVIKYKSSETPATGKVTTGSKGISLSEGDYVVAGLAVRDVNDALAVFTLDGMGKRIKLEEIPLQTRSGKGLAVSKANITAAQLINEKDSILIIGDRNSVCISGEEIPVLSRQAQGVTMIKDNHIITVSKV